MAVKDSPLYNFLMSALIDDKYPSILYWIDSNERIFCLKCLFRSNRQWTTLHSKIFDDYHDLKSRKSIDKRQRFLVAMKVCPFIEYLNDRSTNQKKYYKFRAHGSSTDVTDEISALSTSSEVVEMQTIPVVSVAESGPHFADAAGEIAALSPSNEDVEMQALPVVTTAENEFFSDLSNLDPVQADSNNSLFDVLPGVEIEEELSTDIDSLLDRLDSAVPDVAANDLRSPEMIASTSLYNDSIDFMRNSPSCNQTSESSYIKNLQTEELSCGFEVKAANDDIPLDYDPVKDLIESIETPTSIKMPVVDQLAISKVDPNKLGNVQTISGKSGESSKYQSVKIIKLDDNDEIVRSLRCDNHEKKFFMMVLSTESMSAF